MSFTGGSSRSGPFRRLSEGPWRRLLVRATLLILVGVLSLTQVPAAFASPVEGTADGLALVSGNLANAWSASEALQLEVSSPAGLLGYDASALGSMTMTQPLASGTPVTLGISLIPQDPAGLHDFALAVSTPGNALQGQFLTQAQYDARFAPTPASELAVETALEQAGFTVVHSFPDRSFLYVQGTAGAADQFFGTRLVVGDYEGHAAVMPAVSPGLPTSVSPYVLAVTGLAQDLTEFSIASLTARPLQGSEGPCFTTCNEIFPDWAHFIYGLNNLYNATGGPDGGNWFASGSGNVYDSSIGILLWGDGFDPADISAFQQGMYWGPAFNYTAYPLLGAPAPGPGASSGGDSAMELTLDMEWSEAQAPGAHLDVVYVPEGAAPDYSPSDTDLEYGLSFLLNISKLTVLTQSFGAPEGDQPFQATADMDYQEAAALGITVLAASGDDGGSTGPNGGPCTGTTQTEYPAASPYVTAVGGTSPLVNVSVGGGPAGVLGVNSETAWRFSGGGFSTTYATPSWQRTGTAYQVIQAHGTGDARGIPDVAGPAANDTFYYEGAPQLGEGTSFASPFWAGLIAEMAAIHEGPLGFLDPHLYALGTAMDEGFLSPQPLRFIPSPQAPGTPGNCIYYAQEGWDPVTGYGVPANAFTLYADLVADYVNMTISFNPSYAAPGTSVNIIVTAMNGSKPLDSGTVDVRVFTLPQTLDRTVLLQDSELAVGSNGQVTDTYAIGVTYPYGQILVQAEVFSKHDVGSAASIVQVTLLGPIWGEIKGLMQAPYNYLFFALIMGIAIAIGWVIGLPSAHPNARPFYRRILPSRSSAPRPATARRATAAVPTTQGGAPMSPAAFAARSAQAGPPGITPAPRAPSAPAFVSRPPSSGPPPLVPMTAATNTRPATAASFRPAATTAPSPAPPAPFAPATAAAAPPSVPSPAPAPSKAPSAGSAPPPSSAVSSRLPPGEHSVSSGVTIVMPAARPSSSAADVIAARASSAGASGPGSKSTPKTPSTAFTSGGSSSDSTLASSGLFPPPPRAGDPSWPSHDTEPKAGAPEAEPPSTPAEPSPSEVAAPGVAAEAPSPAAPAPPEEPAPADQGPSEAGMADMLGQMHQDASTAPSPEPEHEEMPSAEAPPPPAQERSESSPAGPAGPMEEHAPSEPPQPVDEGAVAEPAPAEEAPPTPEPVPDESSVPAEAPPPEVTGPAPEAPPEVLEAPPPEPEPEPGPEPEPEPRSAPVPETPPSETSAPAPASMAPEAEPEPAPSPVVEAAAPVVPAPLPSAASAPPPKSKGRGRRSRGSASPAAAVAPVPPVAALPPPPVQLPPPTETIAPAPPPPPPAPTPRASASARAGTRPSRAAKPTKLICPRCGKSIPPTSRSCPSCRAPIKY